MNIYIVAVVENVERYEGKNGFGATITLSQLADKKRKLLSFNISSPEMASRLEESLQEELKLTVELTQNNFGLRLGEIQAVTARNASK